MAKHRVVLVYTWDGCGAPLGPVAQDQPPEFDVVLFDYSGTAAPRHDFPLISVRTECKGEIFREVHRWLADKQDLYDYVGILDDDIETSWSDINRLLRIAREHALDLFGAALSHDSYYSHRQFLVQSGSQVRATAWIEVMMPFYRVGLFMAGGEHYAQSISSYGLDQFVLAALQKLRGFDRVAIIDAVIMRHGRPITSDDRVFANGLTAHQERRIAWRGAIAQVATERPDLLGSPWFWKTFAAWNGPLRFLPLRLQAPWLWWRARQAKRLKRS